MLGKNVFASHMELRSSKIKIVEEKAKVRLASEE